jgi:haemagglutination activity domain
VLAPTDTVIANRNGINVNGGDFLNSNRVTLTTERLNMEKDKLKLIDMT